MRNSEVELHSPRHPSRRRGNDCVPLPYMGSFDRPSVRVTSRPDTRFDSEAANSGSSSSDDGDFDGDEQHWQATRREQVLVDSAWRSACHRVEKLLWKELVTDAVSQLDAEHATATAAAATLHAQRSEVATAATQPVRLVSRVVGAYESSGDEDKCEQGGGREDDESSGGILISRRSSASALYRANKQHAVADAELLRPKVKPEKSRQQEQALTAGILALPAVPRRPRGWPREWSSSWAKLHAQRGKHAIERAADDDLL